LIKSLFAGRVFTNPERLLGGWRSGMGAQTAPVVVAVIERRWRNRSLQGWDTGLHRSPKVVVTLRE
jgi:hypothetical protein